MEIKREQKEEETEGRKQEEEIEERKQKEEEFEGTGCVRREEE